MRNGRKCSVSCSLRRDTLAKLTTPTGHEADIRSLPYEDDSFDVALDKGTMDALMTSKGDVWVRQPES